MLSKSSKYALRGVLYLALNSNEEVKFSPKIIANEIDIPAPFLAKTLQLLSRRGLVSSTKGRNGGFYLTTENRGNALISIIDCIDGLDKFQNCMMGLPICSNENPCPLHDKLAPLRQRLVNELSNKSIDEFVDDIRLGKSHISI